MSNHIFLSSQRLLELASSYKISNSLFAAMELDIFTYLDNQKLESEQLAKKINADPIALEVLLDFLVSFNLLNRENGVYTDSPEASKFLSHSSLYCIDAILKLEKSLKEMIITDERISECVVKGFQGRPDLANIPGFNSIYTNAMSQGGAFTATLVARAARIKGFRKILDLGGGPGIFAITFKRLNPNAEIFLFDTPDITKIALKNIEEAGFADEINIVSGDFMVDSVGENFDCVLMSNICHFYQDLEIRFLLNKVYGCLNENGTLLIHDFFLSDDKKSPSLAVLFTMDWLTHGGFFNLSTSDVEQLLLGENYRDIEYFHWHQIPTSMFKAKKK